MTEPAITPRAGRRYGGVSAQERRTDRYERLILAAIVVYGQHGYRQATVSAVCREAGLTPRYFYEAFANSEALLAAVFREVTEFVVVRIADAGAMAGDGPIDAMRAILIAYYELLRAEPATARVFLLEMTGVSPAIDALFCRSLELFATMIARTLKPQASSAAGRPSLLRTGTIYGLLHIARSWVAGGYGQPIDEVVHAALPLCLLLAGEDASLPT